MYPCCWPDCSTFQRMATAADRMARRVRRSRRNQMSEEGSDMTLSRDDSREATLHGLDDDDLHLWLSQSQPAPIAEPTLQLDESIVDGITASTNNVQMNVREILQIIRNNHNYMTKQNDALFKLVREVSENVSDISEKVSTLERKFCTINKTVKSNKETLVDVKCDIEKLQKTVKTLKTTQMDAVKSDPFGKRLKLIERRLEERDRVPENIAANNNTAGMDDKMVRVKNLPYGMQDEEDVNKLVRDGLGLNVTIKSVTREPSLYNRAGVMTIELHSNDDKMLMVTNKWKLRRTEKYYDVYIEDGNSSTNNRLEKRLQMLVQNVQHGLANISVPPHRYGRYHKRQ